MAPLLHGADNNLEHDNASIHHLCKRRSQLFLETVLVVSLLKTILCYKNYIQQVLISMMILIINFISINASGYYPISQ